MSSHFSLNLETLDHDQGTDEKDLEAIAEVQALTVQSGQVTLFAKNCYFFVALLHFQFTQY